MYLVILLLAQVATLAATVSVEQGLQTYIGRLREQSSVSVSWRMRWLMPDDRIKLERGYQLDSDRSGYRLEIREPGASAQDAESRTVYVWDGQQYASFETTDRALITAAKDRRGDLGLFVWVLAPALSPLKSGESLVAKEAESVDGFISLFDVAQESFAREMQRRLGVGNRLGTRYEWKYGDQPVNPTVVTSMLVDGASWEAFARGPWKREVRVKNETGSMDDVFKTTITLTYADEALRELSHAELLGEGKERVVLDQFQYTWGQELDPSLFSIDPALAASIYDLDAESFIRLE